MITPAELQQLLSQLSNKNSSWATETTLQSIASKIGAIGQANKQLSDGISKGISSIGTETSKVKLSLSDNLQWATDKIGKTFETLSNIKTDLISANFNTVSNGLKNLSTDIKRSHQALSTLISGLSTTSAVLGFLIAKFEESTTMLSGLYGNGVIAQDGLLGLSTAASNAGLTTQNFAELLTKYSNVAIGTGYSRLIKLSKMFADTTNYGSKFIMTNQEAQEALLESMSILQMSGRLRTMSETQVTSATEDYVTEINRLSEATGRNRKEIMAATKEALKLPFSFTLMNSLPEDMKKRFQSVATNMQGVFGDRGKDVFEEFSKFMSVGVSAMGPEMMKLMGGLGGDVSAAMANLKDVTARGGDVDAANFRLLKAFQKIDTQLLARTDPALHAYVIGLQQATKAQYEDSLQLEAMSETDRKRELERRKRDRENAEAQQKVVNTGKAALASMANSIYQVIGALSPALTTAFQALADVTIYIINTIKDSARGIRDWIHKTFFGGTNEPGENKGGANLATAAGILIAGTVGLTLVKTIMGYIFGALAGSVVKGIGKLAGGALGSLGGSTLSKLVGGLLPKLGGGAAAGLAGGGGLIKGLTGLIGLFGSASVIKGAAGIALFSGSIYVLGKALGTFSSIDLDTLYKAGGAIGALALAATAAGIGPVPGFIAAGGLALGVAIGAIGAGIAGAVWLTGNALPTLVEGLEKLSSIDGSALSQVGDGMWELSKGLIALTGAELTKSLSGFATSIIGFFQEDPISKLKRFSEIGQPLKVAADAMQLFSSTLPAAMSALGSFSDIDKAIDVMNKLKETFSTGWFSTRITASDLNSGVFLILKKFADSRDMIRSATEQLNNVGTAAENIDKLRLAMTNFSSASAANVPSQETTTGPVITMNELNIKTLAYYEDSIRKFTELTEKIDQTNSLIDQLRSSSTDNSYRIINAVENSGQRVR